MSDVLILTPDPADPSFAGQWPGVRERLSQALALEGISSAASPWTDHVETADGLSDARLVLPLVAWGYHRDAARWLTACATWEAADVSMLNPPSVLGWNSDKSYLGRLAERGAATPETLWVESPTQADVDAAFNRLGCDTLVVKPRVSGGAWKTQRLAQGEALIDGPQGPAMIQPYLASIETEGETSLLFFGGAFSHAVNKRPVDGDFRIQTQFGGRYRAVQPDAGAMALAERVLAAIDEDLLYARIDLARGADGGWRLMEAELIEPDFYLGQAPDQGRAFARAVRARLS